MTPIEHRSRRRSKRPAAPGAGAARLGWLDALRGFAALTVALHHFGLRLFVPHGRYAAQHFDLGVFGVMLFFLVSGYIVPASLERRGDVRAFWVGRAFRIYPALVVAIVAVTVLIPAGYNTLIDPSVWQHPLRVLPANALLLQDMLGSLNVISVMWTLCYEMVFYFLVTALFAFGLHRNSGPIAVGFGALALLLGAVLVPHGLATDQGAVRNLVLGAVIVVAMGMACVLSGNRSLIRTGAALLGGLGLLLLLTNGRSAPFETLIIFATMFAGTVVHRAERGQIGRAEAFVYCGFVLVAGVVCAWRYDRTGEAHARTWTPDWTAFALAYAACWLVFGLALMLRKRRFPRALTWLGAISYSLYLLHWLVIDLINWRFGMAWLFQDTAAPLSVKAKVLYALGFLAAAFLISYLSYRLVELPFQRLGRRLLTALDRRSRAAVETTVAVQTTAEATGEPEASAWESVPVSSSAGTR